MNKLKVLQISPKFNSTDVYKLVQKTKGNHVTKYKLKYHKLEGLHNSLVNSVAAKAVDTGNGVEFYLDGTNIELDYSQAVHMRLLLKAIALKEDPEYKDVIY